MVYETRRCPSFLQGRKDVCRLSFVLVSVSAARLRGDMVAVMRNFCLVTSNTNYPNSLGPREEGEEDEEGGDRARQ